MCKTSYTIREGEVIFHEESEIDEVIVGVKNPDSLQKLKCIQVRLEVSKALLSWDQDAGVFVVRRFDSVGLAKDQIADVLRFLCEVGQSDFDVSFFGSGQDRRRGRRD
jgi:hypothetical protein